MTAQTETYDGTHYQVVLMNMRDGSVQGHAHGCADLKRGQKFAADQDPEAAWDVLTKAEAWVGYNSDFLAEGGEENAYEIQWLPCAKHVPVGDQHAEYEKAFGEEHVPVAYQEPEKDLTVTSKKGSKWTYIYVGGELVAEVRNDHVGTTLDFLRNPA